MNEKEALQAIREYLNNIAELMTYVDEDPESILLGVMALDELFTEAHDRLERTRQGY